MPQHSYGRYTAKLKMALMKAIDLGITHQSRDELYDNLLKAGLNWDGKTQSWDSNNAWQGSAFVDAHGKPTGHVKIRVMAHPDQIALVTELVEDGLRKAGIIASPTSDKTYPNRKGIGVRVYMEGSIDD